MEMIFPLVEHNCEEGKLFYCSSMKGTNVQTLGAVCGTAAWKMGSPRPLAAAYIRGIYLLAEPVSRRMYIHVMVKTILDWEIGSFSCCHCGMGMNIASLPTATGHGDKVQHGTLLQLFVFHFCVYSYFWSVVHSFATCVAV